MHSPSSDHYTQEFFSAILEDSRKSAAVIVPLVLQRVQPESVIDVGCGVGTWLAEFQLRGVKEILGVDGEYVPETLLQMPSECFVAKDLTTGFDLGRRFDLAVSVEVAEHLPASSAASFVESLTKLAPVVLFSAAIPFQGGTNHINEQWPEYWAELFATHGFEVVDCLRDAIWSDRRVGWWYAQNMLLFVSPEGFARYPALQAERRRTKLAVVHPKTYLAVADPLAWGVRRLLNLLPGAVVRAIARRWRRWMS